MRPFMLAAAAAAALAWAVPAAAASQRPEPPAQADLAEAAREIDQLDTNRLFADSDYAERILAAVERLFAAAPDDEALHAAFDDLRLFALGALGRGDQAAPLVDRALARRPRAASRYAAPWIAAVGTGDDGRALAVVETASRNVPSREWAELRELLSQQAVWPLLGRFRRASDDEAGARLAEALFRIGWPGADTRGGADGLRAVLIDDRLRRGDRAAAAQLAAMVDSPGALLPLMVMKRYDGLLPAGADRTEPLRRALVREDVETEADFAASPDNPKRRLDRVQHLRSVGRNADALALLGPYIADPAAMARESEDSMWLVNEAAFALVAEGRPAEAAAVMRPLAALPLADHSYLVNTSINLIEILTLAGEAEAAVDHAERLRQEAGDYASDYGKMWIEAGSVCALAELDRPAEAAPAMERMRALDDANHAALTMAHLCLADEEAAAALMVRRLEGAQAESAALALQDYALSRGGAQMSRLHERLLALRERPEVRAAFDRVAHATTLPLARAYWGGF